MFLYIGWRFAGGSARALTCGVQPYEVSMNSRILMILAGTVALLLVSAPALAYIDPGTGSFLVQGLIAAALGAVVVIKAYWHRIRSVFGGRSVKDDDDDE